MKQIDADQHDIELDHDTSKGESSAIVPIMRVTTPIPPEAVKNDINSSSTTAEHRGAFQRHNHETKIRDHHLNPQNTLHNRNVHAA